jgi:hypothetical protein
MKKILLLIKKGLPKPFFVYPGSRRPRLRGGGREVDF